MVLLSVGSFLPRGGGLRVLFAHGLARLDEQLTQLVNEFLANIEWQIRHADGGLEQRALGRVMLPALHGILRREVERIFSSEDGASDAGLQPGLLKKPGKLQQRRLPAVRIDAKGQAFNLFLLGHPKWNGESSLPELEFDMWAAVEPMGPKDLPFLEIERMERIIHRNFALIAGIIAVGSKA